MSWTRSVSEQLARDHEALNLARALADGGQLHIAEVLLGGIVLHETVAAVDLDAVVGDLHRDLAGVQLGHGRLERGPLSARLEVRGLVRQQTRRLDLRRGIGQLPLDRLEARDRLAERLAVAGVAQRRLVRALREPDGE